MVTPHSLLTEARVELDAARRLLLDASADNVRKSTGHLARVADRLKDIRVEKSPALAVEVDHLRKELKQIGVLLQSAAGFHAERAELLASTGDAYTPTGEPVVAPPPPAHVLEG
jgi:hypothetical protein